MKLRKKDGRGGHRKVARRSGRFAGESRPFGIGLNGHARSCDCGACAESRIARVLEYVKHPKVKPPASGLCTVLVRAHFRRQPRHLAKWPLTKRLMREAIGGLS